MSEYMEKHSVSRLIGAPPGYIGHDDGGQLTEAVRRKPYSVVLFDEIEKAHSEVFNVLLQILDDGRLTDSKGRTVDFRNVVVIMTSNLAAQTLINEIGETGNISEATRKTVLKEVKTFFKPEFFNRVDDIVLFAPLQKSELEHIIELQLADIQKRLEERSIGIDLDKESKDWLISRGYSPVYGARPLKRLLQKEIETLLAKAIITGEISDGNHVKISIENDRPVIVK